MAKRKSAGKKLRFEIFKRDRFACQYCGRQAPDVVLVVDHLKPVAGGGDNEMLNLITSCVDCNAGKGARALDDQSAVAKQRAEIERLAERREQIDMMLDWSRGLSRSAGDEVSAFAVRWRELLDDQFFLNERGEAELRKHLRKFGLQALLAAVHTAVTQYVKRGADGKLTQDSVELAWNRMPGIALVSALPAPERELYYIRGIVRNAFGLKRGDSWDREALDLLRAAFNAGVPLDQLSRLARSSRSLSSFRSDIQYDTDAALKDLDT